MANDFYGDAFKPFAGIVEEVVDQTYVRARILGIHPMDKLKVPTEHLPLAQVIYPTSGGQVGSGAISHNIEIDSWVIGMITDYPHCMQPIITGVIQGAEYSMSTYSSGGGEFVGDGAGAAAPGLDSGTSVNIPGSNNIQKTYNFVYSKLTSEGSSSDPHLHTSALVGVLLLETTGINPAVVGGYKGRAWGICQWLGPRRKKLFATYGRTKRLDQQLSFMWWELNNTERRAKGLWLRASNLPDAVAGFCMFERAEEVQGGKVNRQHGNFKKRLAFAYEVYQNYKYSGGSANFTNYSNGAV